MQDNSAIHPAPMFQPCGLLPCREALPWYSVQHPHQLVRLQPRQPGLGSNRRVQRQPPKAAIRLHSPTCHLRHGRQLPGDLQSGHQHLGPML
jgi:hypothetical protein